MPHPVHHQPPFTPPPTHGGEVLLVRHGQSEANAQGIAQGRADYPLSDKGRAQAQVTGEHLKALGGVSALYSSPLARAAETAQIIAEALGMTVEYVDDLAEVDVGAFSGITWAELKRRYPDEVAAYEAAEASKPHPTNRELLPGWEPVAAVVPRMWAAVNAIAHRHAGERVVVVSHGAVISCYLTHLLTGDAHETPWCHSSSNCAISHVLFTPEGPRTACLTDATHLDELAGSAAVFHQTSEGTAP